MRKAFKKLYISILTIILVVFTMVSTTFAWVGIFTHTQVSPFDLNLKVQDLDDDYYLVISATGKEGTFGETANPDELKEQILYHMNKNFDYFPDKTNDLDRYYSAINKEFNKLLLAPVTTSKEELINSEFYGLNHIDKVSVSNQKSTSFFRFDLYISVEHRSGDEAISNNVTNVVEIILSDIENSLVGSKDPYKIANDFTYPSNNTLAEIYTNFSKIDKEQEISIDTASSTRLAFALYNPIERGTSYSNTESPFDIIIYQGGTQNPTYFESTNTYSFGGILPEEYNLAHTEYKKKYKLGSDKFKIPIEKINRGDLELIPENSKLVDKEKKLGVINGKKMMMKITVFFWYEGWDADCFEIIRGENVKINLSFATDTITNM